MQSLCTHQKYSEKSLIGPGDYEVKDKFNSRKKESVRNVFAMAAKKSIAD